MPPIDKLIADFDGTVSEVDTLGLLVQTATKHRTIAGEAGAQASFFEWRETVEWYSQQCDRIAGEWLVSDHEETTHAQNIPRSTPDPAGLQGFLDDFEVLEYSSTRRVMERRFLSGLTREALRALGRSVQKRPGVSKVMEEMRTIGVKIEILSANWSKAFIEGAMEGLCDQITTNCLEFDKSGRSTGEIHLRVISAQDKLRHFLRRKCECCPADATQGMTEQQGTLGTRAGRTLYIGDSVTDLLAILEADFGVLIGTKQTAVQTIKGFGIPTRTITDLDRIDSIRHDERTVLRVDSWETLGHFLKNETSYAK